MLTAGFFLPVRGRFEDPSTVKVIIGEAAKSPAPLQKLRNNLSVLDGSAGNIVVFTGPEGKLMVDAGIDVSKHKIKKVLAGLGKNPQVPDQYALAL
jgi:hypothetical protein